jgi:two-component system chemotaxis response regulator CheB
MGISRTGNIILSKETQINSLRPSVSFLFRSVAEAYGKDAIGVLLTGMGYDGSAELKLMRDMGAVTFAQDEGSSVVFGMPGEAVKLGGAVFVLTPAEIILKIIEIIRR